LVQINASPSHLTTLTQEGVNHCNAEDCVLVSYELG